MRRRLQVPATGRPATPIVPRVALTALVTLATACTRDAPTAPAAPELFEATIAAVPPATPASAPPGAPTLPSTLAYTGTGRMLRLAFALDDSLRLVSVISSGTGASAGHGFQVTFLREPRVGRYSAALTGTAGTLDVAPVLYTIVDAAGRHAFAADSGTVTVEEVSTQRITGRFAFVARWQSSCTLPTPGSTSRPPLLCEYPRSSAAGMPGVRVEGRFSAVASRRP
jgi:hypothetical protein